VLCFLLVCPATDKENTPVFNQQNIETAHKLQDDENDIEKEENPYFGGLISGQRADCIERETPEIKIPLLKICDDGNAIDDNFAVSLGSASGAVQITLSSVFDNYLHLIDPAFNSLNQNGVDFDDDSGNGANASITRFLSSSHDYFIVYVQFDPSTHFVNLNEGVI